MRSPRHLLTAHLPTISLGQLFPLNCDDFTEAITALRMANVFYFIPSILGNASFAATWTTNVTGHDNLPVGLGPS